MTGNRKDDDHLLPMLVFKDSAKSVFASHRQCEEICQKIIECIEVVAPDNRVVRFADLAKFDTLIEFMKCFPILVKRDKNSSQTMNYIMDANSHRMKQVKVREGEDAHISAQIGQANLDYVKQLMSLIFSRIEDKHRNVTEMFRFMDQRGQGKIDRKDFYSAIDRMRISLSREDANKVWDYLDMNKNGYI